MHAQLDDLLTATYVLVDDFLPKRRGPGRPPRITDAELITLAIAQVFMGLPNDRQFLALAGYRLSHLFAYLPRQSGYNKRLRALTPQIERAINYLAFCSPGWCDQLRLLDSTPVPCAASRETVRRSEFAGIAAYGYCRSHSRYFWGFRLYLLCASDGTPIAFELAPANAPEREVAREMLERVPLAGSHRHRRQGLRRRRVRGLDGRSRSRVPSSRSQGRAAPIRIARARAPVDRIGLLDLQGTARPRAHGARTLRGLCARVGLRLLALAAGLRITPRSVNLAGASAPMATNSGSTI